MGDVHVVAVLHEPAEGAAHGQDVVVGMRGKDEDPLGEYPCRPRAQRAHRGVARAGLGRVSAAGPAGDRVLHLVEPGEVRLVGRAVHADQVLQPRLVVVVVGQFEDGFPQGLGEPQDRAAGHPRVPGKPLVVEGAQEPRSAEAREGAGGGLVHHVERVVMVLQEGRGDLGGDLPLDRLADDPRLVLAPGHQDDPARLEDRADAHRDRVAGGVHLAPEVPRGVPSSQGIQGDLAGAGALGASGLVEADVAGAPDPEDLEVDPARRPDGRLVLLAVGVHLGLGHRPVGNVRVLGQDVDVVEQVRLHEVPVASGLGGRHREVLVQVEADDVAEAQALLAVEANELGVKVERRRSGRQAQDGRLALGLASADQGRDLAGDRLGGLHAVGEYDQGYVLEAVGSRGAGFDHRWECFPVSIRS